MSALEESPTLVQIVGVGEFDPGSDVSSAVRAFYDGNSLARVVSDGRTSFEEEVKFIAEKYKTPKLKARAQKIDDNFDIKVAEVLNSMREVGISGYAPEQFTTRGHNEYLKSWRAQEWRSLGLIPLGMISIPIATAASRSQIEGAIFGLVVMLGGVALYYHHKFGMSGIMKNSLEYLSTDARHTDHFLRQNPYPT